MHRLLRFLYFCAVCLLAACGGGGSAEGAVSVGMSAAARVGQQIFNDQTLSASGAMSCATCHDPSIGHASPFTTPVAFGGQNLDVPGTRLPPAIGYLKFNSGFKFDIDGTPMGGFFWDGRVNSLAEQGKKPFLGNNEMANLSAQDVISKIQRASYAETFKQVFGANIFNDPNAAFDRVGFALERFQSEDSSFAPFSSKFDAVTAGKASFTEQEVRGLAWFNRSDKGNCTACHPSTKPDNAPAALFTDFTYDSLGVPRNSDISANAVPTFFDQGLCGSTRTDLSGRTDLCGKFKVPSLRNVALRKRFFHNGKFDSLEQVVLFYVTRDTNPENWYSKDSLGNVISYDDLPASVRGNVNVTEGPYNRKLGQAPALNAQEVADLVAFLQTLSDGYTP